MKEEGFVPNGDFGALYGEELQSHEYASSIEPVSIDKAFKLLEQQQGKFGKNNMFDMSPFYSVQLRKNGDRIFFKKYTRNNNCLNANIFKLDDIKLDKTTSDYIYKSKNQDICWDWRHDEWEIRPRSSNKGGKKKTYRRKSKRRK